MKLQNPTIPQALGTTSSPTFASVTINDVKTLSIADDIGHLLAHYDADAGWIIDAPLIVDLSAAGPNNGTDGSGLTGVVANNGMALDSGWGTNTATADKTVVLANFSGVAALNTVVGGAGTQIQNLTQKVAALETALANRLLPNV